MKAIEAIGGSLPLKAEQFAQRAYAYALNPLRNPLKEILDVVRGAHEGISLNLEPTPVSVEVDRLMDALERALEQTLEGYTVKDLALVEAPPTVSPIASHHGTSHQGGEP